MHAHHQHFLVMRAIENADAPALGDVLAGAPQKIVGDLLGAGRLVGVYLAALRIDAGHHVLDHAVLSRRIHALKHDQHGPSAMGIKTLLQFGDAGDPVGKDRLHVVDVGREPEALGGTVIGKLEVAGVIDPAPPDDLLGDLFDLGGFHRRGPLIRATD